MTWTAFSSPAARCRTCRLWQDSHGVVCLAGEGDPRAKIALVGQSPGEDEELLSENFVGRAGQLLNRCIADAGLLRSDLWICNAVRCRPTKLIELRGTQSRKNRVPTPEEIDACHGYIDEELKRLCPKVIVTLGKEAAITILGEERLAGGVLENQGKIQWSDEYQAWVITTVHPSYLLRRPGEQEMLVFDLEKAARWAERPPVPEPVEYKVVVGVEAVRELRDLLLVGSELAFDWETNGLHLTKSIGFCIAFARREREAFVVPRYRSGLAPLYTPAHLREVDTLLREILLSSVPKSGSNVGFDMSISETTLGVTPSNVTFDCQSADHCINNHLPRAHNLKAMADRYTDMGRYDDALDKWLVANGYTDNGKPDMGYVWKAPDTLVHYYACCDADATIRVKHILQTRLVEEGVAETYYNERLPLGLEHSAIDRVGVRINIPYANQLAGQLTEALAAATRAISESVGQEIIERIRGKADFNLNSYPQVGKLLFDELGVPVLGYADSGGPSTREEFLLPVKDFHPVISALLHHRAYTKLKGYVDGTRGGKGILSVVDEDGYARMNTIVCGTETFRMVTRRPFALYTWPKTVPGMPSVRAMIIPREGYKIVARDYVQQEFVIQAIAANQTDLIEAMLDRGEDIHERVMTDLFGKTKADFPDTGEGHQAYSGLRSKAKSLNFMILFRGGAPKLARTLQIDEAEAGQYIADYGERYDRIRWWQYEKIKQVRETGRSFGLFTTYRKLPAIKATWDRFSIYEAERQGCNFPIQNGGAHVLGRAVLRVIRWIRENNYPARVLFCLHDQILTEVRSDLAEEWGAILGRIMEEPVPELSGRAPRTNAEISEAWAS